MTEKENTNQMIYNPFEDTDVRLPVYKRNGKNLILPMFICGVKLVEITSRNNEDLVLADLEFEIHPIAAEKMEPIDTFHEDEDGNYNYRAPKEETANPALFVGQRVKAGQKAKLWKNLSKASGRMNRILLEQLKALGIEIKTVKIEHDKKKIDAPVIPDLTEDLLMGLPVFGWLDQESFTDSRSGKNVTTVRVNKIVKMDNVERTVVIENSLDEKKKSTKSAPKDQDDPFGDDDIPF